MHSVYTCIALHVLAYSLHRPSHHNPSVFSHTLVNPLRLVLSRHILSHILSHVHSHIHSHSSNHKSQSNTAEMSQGEVTRFPQTNASLKVPSLGTVESILSATDESIFAKPRTRSQFENFFEAIETTLQAQENHIVSQDTEMAGLHAKITDLNKRITDLNEHIVKISMASSGHSASNRARKSVIADPDIFKGDKLDNKKNQELFQTFSAEVELKMIGDDKCFETNREKNPLCGK